MTRRQPAELPALAPGDPVFAYARDSGGATQEASVSQQRERVTAWADAHGYTIAGWYVDERMPGDDFERRAQFQAMMDACRQQPAPVRAVVAWDLARFGRAQAERLYYIADLRRHGVRVVSVSEETPDGIFAPVVESVLALKDQLYLEDLSRNVTRGLAAAAEQGRNNGPRAPVGYVRTVQQIGTHRDGTPRLVQRWQIDEARADDVRTAFRLYASGAGVREIHERLHLFATREGYRDFFHNELYIGVVISGRYRRADAGLRIVDDATWQAVQDRRRAPLPPRQVSSRYLLSGLLFCGVCGRRMIGKTKRNQARTHTYYYCQGTVLLDAPCDVRTVAGPVDVAVLVTVTARLAEPANVATLLAELQAVHATTHEPAAALDAAITQAERAITGLLDLAESGTLALPEIRRRLAERERALSDLRAQRAALPVVQAQPFDAEYVRAALARIAAGLGDTSVPVQRRALAAILERITFHPLTGIELFYRENMGPV